ncbi:daunorubicin C-13 ketoreductase DnrU [Seminavis robusta]|uniref:Daunorubicin C-13 ketoreductase DnrU n=1 Tax=Seminavis robusta TaxID=568900 RepID=A0A9N8EQQ2_9STRA|nr:daunorubicin C-13 ketoreductase DnrU [Seminavis robusta]|eukprot:Sro1569_g283120.1 daunorubicin C-13 ketoreductase DnrU (293) ;mRNA; r:5576-6454
MSLSLSATSNRRKILITGSTDGIGKHTAEKLAKDGHDLLIHGRQPKLGAKIAEELKAKGAHSVQYFNADLGDLTQVEQLARDVQEALQDDDAHLDVLINNAGIFDPPRPAKSVQGYDMTWAVNVMAPYVLTRRLLPLLAASSDACPRIITTSSISQSYTMPPLDQLFAINDTPKGGHAAYSDSKLGDYMFTVELARILKQQQKQGGYGKIKCLTMDPGTVNTKMLLAGWGACGINVKRADNTYQLATDYGASQESGTYHFGGGGSRDAKDRTKTRALFERLQECTGVTYDDL